MDPAETRPLQSTSPLALLRRASDRQPSRAVLTPEAAGLHRRSFALTAAFACVAMLVSYLPFSGVNGVLGTIRESTGASGAELQWLVDAFAVALTGAVLSAGVVGDLIGRRRVVLAGLALTTAGSLIGLVSGWLAPGATLPALWTAQAVAGFGAGGVMSASLGLIAAGAPSPASRARTIALWSAALTVGLGAGPFLAGTIADHVNFQWLYAPMAVLAVATMAFGFACSDESSAPDDRRLDWTGQTTAVLGVTGIAFGVIEGGSSGWTLAPAVIGLAAGLTGLAAFVIAERRAASPLLRLELFGSGGFVAAGISAMSVLFSIVGLVFVLSLFFSRQGVSDLGIAERLAWLFAANAAAGLVAGRLDVVSPRAKLAGGLGLAAIGAASLATIGPATGLAECAWRLGLVGAGSGLVMATSTTVAVQSVAAPLMGMAGAANNVMRQLGGALGGAVLGVIYTSAPRHGTAAAAVHTSALTVAALLALAFVAAVVLLRG